MVRDIRPSANVLVLIGVEGAAMLGEVPLHRLIHELAIAQTQIECDDRGRLLGTSSGSLTGSDPLGDAAPSRLRSAPRVPHDVGHLTRRVASVVDLGWLDLAEPSAVPTRGEDAPTIWPSVGTSPGVAVDDTDTATVVVVAVDRSGRARLDDVPQPTHANIRGVMADMARMRRGWDKDPSCPVGRLLGVRRRPLQPVAEVRTSATDPVRAARDQPWPGSGVVNVELDAMRIGTSDHRLVGAR